MVKIRLKRMGTTKRPVYRLVVADSRSPRDGRFIESIGFYDPLPNPAIVSIDADRVRLWLGRGARPSDSARQLLVNEGILAARPFKASAKPEPAGSTKESGNGAATPPSAEVPAQGAADAGDAAGGSPEATSEEPRAGVPAAAGPAPAEPAADESVEAAAAEPAE